MMIRPPFTMNPVILQRARQCGLSAIVEVMHSNSRAPLPHRPEIEAENLRLARGQKINTQV